MTCSPYRSLFDIVTDVMFCGCGARKVECSKCGRLVCSTEILADGCVICSESQALVRLARYGVVDRVTGSPG